MNFPWLLIVLGLGIDPVGSKTQLDDGCLYNNYFDHQAYMAYLGGDKKIEEDLWDIDLGSFIELKMERG
tara:strand:- start:189 stop:395 length:207 start_codon:yes stop_codon:yes gene_type:complete